MISRRTLFVIPGLAALAVVGCSNDPAPKGSELKATTSLLDLPMDTNGVSEAAQHTSDIGWELIRQHEEARTENLTLSPSSLVLALATVAEGATGQSETSLNDALGAAGEARSKAYGALRQSLKAYEDLPEELDAKNPPETPVVHQANRVVIMAGQEVQQEFLDTVGTYHGTQTVQVSLADAKDELSRWVREHTAEVIKESAIEPDGDTLLVLQDALLFAAKWRKEFDVEDAPLTFRNEAGTKQVRALEDTFFIPHAKTDSFQAVRLPYDDVLAMDVILTAEGTHPTEIDAAQLWQIHEALSAAEKTEAVVTMPPSKTEATWDLMEALAGVGIDLSELDGIATGAHAGQVAQQAVLEVTAKGTVGAAVTEIEVEVEAAPDPAEPEIFEANRPFIMRVLDTRTGWPLFLALINSAA